MSNSRTQRVNYTPRMTQVEAYDALPLDIKRVMQIGPQEWDTYYVLRAYKKQLKTWPEGRAAANVIRMVHKWHRNEVRDGKPWRPRKPGQKWSDVPPSPHVLAGGAMI